jgi:hypothetical protein
MVPIQVVLWSVWPSFGGQLFWVPFLYWPHSAVSLWLVLYTALFLHSIVYVTLVQIL